MMKERDQAKANASRLAKEGRDNSLKQTEYKRLRNRINNRIKFEERSFKREKMLDNLESPSTCWSLAKDFMNWTSNGGPPTQLDFEGRLVYKAAEIANIMNRFFLNKVTRI